MTIIEELSPNFNARPSGTRISLIVIHGTMGTDEGDLIWTTDSESDVSYHYLIQRDGDIYRTVADHHRAWHAGTSKWNGRGNVNNYSIGIGLSNSGTGNVYTDEQYKAVGWLCAVLIKKYDLAISDVVGHHHISGEHLHIRTDPKSDPWLYFDWMRLAERIILEIPQLPR